MKRNALAPVFGCILLLAACSGSSHTDNAVPALLAPTVSLTSSASSVLQGQPVTLTWTSANATACTASGDWVGVKTTAGSENVTVHPGANSYTLTCTGAGGSSAQSISVTGTTTPPPPTAPTVSLTSSASSVLQGQPVTLTWTSANATACTASGDWIGIKTTAGSENVTVHPGANSYTLTCTGAGGSSAQSITVTGTTTPPTGAAQFKVLSNRSDLISGGDALIEVVPPAGTSPSSVAVDNNGQDITNAFAMRANGRYMGLVTGLSLGANMLTAHFPDGSKVGTTITNHPNSGPIFSGPQLQPWTCRNSAATDAQCNQPSEYSYLYKSTDPSKTALQPYDPKNPATDVATTTTDQGVTVPYIVRQETGYQDRDQYKIAVLFQPGKPWSGPEPQAQFNHKLVITHGVSCGVDYQSGGAPSVTSFNPADVSGAGLPALGADSINYALGAGYAVMSTALDYSGHNCNVALQAESLMMAKEHLIETYGTLRYSIGTGCSGGSLAQQWIANAYPGIYQGILPTCSFADAWGTATQFADYHLLLAYLLAPSKWGSGVEWSPTQMADVEGHITIVNSEVSDNAQWHVAVPTDHCAGISDAQRYDPTNNPGGVRCSITDAAINIFGPRPPALWNDNEKKIGRGFAGFPIDNVGVQYGLAVLQAGTITAAQFLDLNTKVGGLDVDTNPIPQRTPAVEPALANAYRSGMINETNNLNRTAIIDCRGPDPGAFHDSYRAFAIRARLDREHGTHANQLIWEGPAPIVGDSNCGLNSLKTMDQWLAAVEKDISGKPTAQKLVDDKPAGLGDQCWDGSGTKLTDGLCPQPVVPVYGTPRMVAGDAISTDTNKCQLKLLKRSDNYGPIGFSDAEWAQMPALFPAGVCDYSKPGVSQQPTIPWQAYQDNAGKVIYGGQPLPAVPAGVAPGWASAAFFYGP